MSLYKLSKEKIKENNEVLKELKESANLLLKNAEACGSEMTGEFLQKIALELGQVALDMNRLEISTSEWKTVQEHLGSVKKIKNKEMPIEGLDLSVSTYNALKRAGINFAYQIISKTDEELMLIRNLNVKRIKELKERLESNGLIKKEDN